MAARTTRRTLTTQPAICGGEPGRARGLAAIHGVELRHQLAHPALEAPDLGSEAQADRQVAIDASAMVRRGPVAAIRSARVSSVADSIVIRLLIGDQPSGRATRARSRPRHLSLLQWERLGGGEIQSTTGGRVPPGSGRYRATAPAASGRPQCSGSRSASADRMAVPRVVMMIVPPLSRGHRTGDDGPGKGERGPPECLSLPTLVTEAASPLPNHAYRYAHARTYKVVPVIVPAPGPFVPVHARDLGSD